MEIMDLAEVNVIYEIKKPIIDRLFSFKKCYFPEEKCLTNRLAATAQTVHMTHVQGLNSGVKPKPAN